MHPGQPVRFRCGEWKWAQELAEATGHAPDDIEPVGNPISCEFCGAGDVKATHDRPVTAWRAARPPQSFTSCGPRVASRQSALADGQRDRAIAELRKPVEYY
jgi:hypothetical protein